MTLDNAKELDIFLTQFLEKDECLTYDYKIFQLDNIISESELSEEKIQNYLSIACLRFFLQKTVSQFRSVSYKANVNESLNIFLNAGGFEGEYIRVQKDLEAKNYKEQLETEKSEREIEKLKYEEANQELDTKIKGLTKQNLELSNENAILTKTNLTLQNWDIRFRWAIAVGTFAAGFLLRACWLALSRLWQ